MLDDDGLIQFWRDELHKASATAKLVIVVVEIQMVPRHSIRMFAAL
jgi:hypothetical protein